MTGQFFIEGKNFISADDAAVRSGYTRDHIARLCREGKLEGTKVGTTWYVEETSLQDILTTTDTIVADGKRYISASEAAKTIGYARNYVLQLCRDGRVDAQKVGDSWLVEEGSVKHFFLLQQRMKIARDAQLAEDGRKERLGDSVSASQAAYRSRSGKLASPKEPVQLRAQAPTLRRSYAGATAFLVCAFLLGAGYVVADGYQSGVFALPTVPEQDALLASAGSAEVKVEQVAAPIWGFFGTAFSRTVIFTRDLANAFIGAPITGNVSVKIVATPRPVIATSPNITSLSIGTPITRTIINQPVIERIRESVQTISTGGITPELLAAALEQLDNKLSSQIALVTASGNATYQVVAQTNRIDQLTGVDIYSSTVHGLDGLTDADIPDGITASNYVLLTGGSISGTLTTSDLIATNATTTNATSTNFFSTLGTFTTGIFDTASTSNLIVANATTTNATSTNFFATTFRATNATITSLLTAAAATITNLTATNSIFTNATTTNATTTNLSIAGTISVPLTNGCVEVNSGLLTSTGTNCGLGGGGITNLNGLTGSSQTFATSTTGSGIGLTITSSGSIHTFHTSVLSGYSIPLTASTTEWDTAYLDRIASATYPLQIASNVLSLAFGTTTDNTWSGTQAFTIATATDLVASNSFTFRNVTGFLKATAGSVATALIDLTSDITGILAATHGGTGWAAIQSGSVLYGNGASALATSSALTFDGTKLIATYASSTSFTASGSVYLATSGGNVGVGTTSPTQTLSVAGGGITIDRVGSEPFVLFTATSTSVAQIRGVNGGGLRFTNGATSAEWARFDSSGNFGVGTTSPWAKLSINNSTADTAGKPLFVVASSTATATTTAFIIANSGNVGIGTTNPVAALSVQNSSALLSSFTNIGAYYNNESNGYSSLQMYNTTGNYIDFIGAASRDYDFRQIYTATANTLTFSASSTANMLVLNGNGNVGVGTTSPLVSLDVRGTAGTVVTSGAFRSAASIYNQLILDNLDGTSLKNQISFRSNNTPKWSLGNDASGTGGQDFFIYDEVGLARRFTIDSSGNVGIGDSTPTSLLTVGSGDYFQVDTTGIIYQNMSNSNYDVWIQGGAPGTASGDTRNLALIGSVTADDLILNYNTEYDCVSVGGTSCAYALDVAGTGNFTGDVNVGTTNTDPVGNNVAGSHIDASGYVDANRSAGAAAYFGRTTDGSVVGIASAGTVEGFISVSGATVSYGAFTGSHYALLSGDASRGELMTLTGDNKNYHDNPESEVLYGIEKSTKENDSQILGAYLALLEPTDPRSVENPDQVMAVGNGDMWVADTGSDLAIGDYLISSAVPGHAEKDPEADPVSYIIARVAEPVQWGSVTTTINGVRHKKISIFFENFTRSNGVDLAGLIASSTTLTTPVSDALIDQFFANVFARVSGWLASADNGITDLFATTVHAKNIFADTVNAKTLCLDDVCVTRDQLKALLDGQVAAVAVPVTNTPPTSTPTPDTTPPTITLTGASSITIAIGDTYLDLGATVTDPSSYSGQATNNNLGYTVSLDGATSTTPDQLSLDTTTAGNHTILFSATDQSGNTSTATRTVVVGSPVDPSNTSGQAAEEQAATTTEATTTLDVTPVSSSTPQQ